MNKFHSEYFKKCMYYLFENWAMRTRFFKTTCRKARFDHLPLDWIEYYSTEYILNMIFEFSAFLACIWPTTYIYASKPSFLGHLQYLDISLGPLAVFWSKTTLNTGCVSGTWVDPTSCKMGSFFLRSLALSVPIYRNFQSNGAKWRCMKLWVLLL